MYAVSTSTDGISGDFSTRNGACCTSRLRIAVTADMRLISRWPAADARAQRRALRQIEQHAREQLILVRERHAADQVGRVLALREQQRRFVARALFRQHVDRRALAHSHRGTSRRGWR